MLDALFGLILLGLGVKKSLPPVVLGDHDNATEATGSSGSSANDSDEADDHATGATSSSAGTSSDDDFNDDDTKEATGGLKIMRPKLTVEQQKEFQRERAKREKNIAHISESRVKELHDDFLAKQKARLEKDKAGKAALEAKLRTFKDKEKKEKLTRFSAKYQSTVTSRLTDMQKKLESMTALLDRITAATGALKAQGKDVSHIETSVSTAQAKVTTATSLVTALAGSISTNVSVSTETSAKSDIQAAVTALKAQLEPARAAFIEAYQAVSSALHGVEVLTNAVEEATPTP